MPRPSHFNIDLDALAQNFEALSRLAGSRRKMAVVKANAYGHGALACARVLEHSVDAFAVAITEEAIELREAGIDKPILVLQGPHSSDDLDTISAHSLWPAVSNHHQLNWLIAQTDKPDQVWLKVDTGMHRLGFDPNDVADARSALNAAGIRNTTLMSHLADAEDAESALTHRQAARWNDLLKDQNDGAESDKQASFSNSASTVGALSPPESWVRLGYSLYGGSLIDLPVGLQLSPVMTFTSKVAATRWIEAGETVGYGGRWVAQRRSRIATIPVGYGDGYPRAAADGTPIGTPYGTIPLAGKVSMDMITADVTDIPDIDFGTKVTLWGGTPSVDEVATHCNTIGYELCTRITARTPRQFSR
ncbi:alanine racemase [gamma proteobacterium HIMB55]|nr:alanine racemase [gamma proteobacterium HIMB55]